MGKVKKKKYSKTVAFLNKYNVPEHKALATLKIYAKQETSHLVRVRSWPMICYDTLSMLKELPKNKNKSDSTIIWNYVNTRDYVMIAKLMGRKTNISQEKRARNFKDNIKKHKKKYQIK
jgi:hypothetical protein